MPKLYAGNGGVSRAAVGGSLDRSLSGSKTSGSFERPKGETAVKVNRYTKFVSIVMVGMLAGCHGQQMLRRDPASFSPSDLPSPIGLVTTEDVAITFDEPGTIEPGQVVYRVDGTQASMSLDDIDHLVLIERTLDKKKTLMAILAPLAVIFSWPLWLGIFVEECSDPSGCN